MSFNWRAVAQPLVDLKSAEQYAAYFAASSYSVATRVTDR